MAISKSLWTLLFGWLVQKHTDEQEAIANEVTEGVVRAFRRLNFERLDETTPAFLDLALPVVRKGFERSQLASIQFMDDLDAVVGASRGVLVNSSSDVIAAPRDAKGAAKLVARLAELNAQNRAGAPDWDDLSVRLAERLDEIRAAAALAATGPGGVKRAMPAPESTAMAKGLKGAAGAAVKAALGGGRDAVRRRTDESLYATGFQRVTDADPCYFCALLASLGAFYKNGKAFNASNSKYERNTAFEVEPDNIAKVHDHCRCTLAPVYEGFETEDEWGKVSLRLWSNVTGDGFSGGDAMREYRKRYDAVAEHIHAKPTSDEEVLQRIFDALETLDPDSVEAKVLRRFVVD